MSKEMKRAAQPQDRISLSVAQSVDVLASVTSVQISKQSNVRPRTAKVRLRGCELAIFDDDRAPVTVVGYDPRPLDVSWCVMVMIRAVGTVVRTFQGIPGWHKS